MDASLRERKEFKSKTGPGGVGVTFSGQAVRDGLLWIALIMGIPALYPEQEMCILSMFIGIMHVLYLQPTGAGKTIAFWGCPLLYHYLFNIRELHDQRFYPVLIVFSPLSSLMRSHVVDFNRRVQNVDLGWRAEQISDLQTDSKVDSCIITKSLHYKNLPPYSHLLGF